jgi:hypothetical protein
MSVNELSISDKRQIKQILRRGIMNFTKDPDYPLPDIGERMLDDWSKNMTNYNDLIDLYLSENTNAKPGKLVEKGIFPYVMAFQEFFKEQYIEDGVTVKCDKNESDKPDSDKPDSDKPDSDKPDSDKPDTNNKIGPILNEKLQNGTTYKLSDGYCYDLEELYGIKPHLNDNLFLSPFTRVPFDVTEQVFLRVIKSFDSNKISLFNVKSSVGGSKYTKRKRSNAGKKNGTRRHKQNRKSRRKRKPKKKL